MAGGFAHGDTGWPGATAECDLTTGPRLASADDARVRPPAVPLVAHDPYFSIWSPADRLTDAATVHWTGRGASDDIMKPSTANTARLMGRDAANIAALPHTSVTVRPTHYV